MAFIPAVNTAQVRINQTFNGEKISNTLYVENSVAWTLATLTDLANTVISAWNSHLGPVHSGACQYQSVSVRDMTTSEGLGIEIGFPALSGGDRVGPPMPGNVALVMKFITNFSGPNRRGRMYLGGFEEDQQDGNHFTDAAKAQIETNMRSFIQQIQAANFIPVVASFYNGTVLTPMPNGETRKRPVPRGTALLTPITNVVGDVQIDSQRRRLTKST